jgi:hypothetical protein
MKLERTIIFDGISLLPRSFSLPALGVWLSFSDLVFPIPYIFNKYVLLLMYDFVYM